MVTVKIMKNNNCVDYLLWGNELVIQLIFLFLELISMVSQEVQVISFKA